MCFFFFYIYFPLPPSTPALLILLPSILLDQSGHKHLFISDILKDIYNIQINVYIHTPPHTHTQQKKKKLNNYFRSFPHFAIELTLELKGNLKFL